MSNDQFPGTQNQGQGDPNASNQNPWAPPTPDESAWQGSSLSQPSATSQPSAPADAPWGQPSATSQPSAGYDSGYAQTYAQPQDQYGQNQYGQNQYGQNQYGQDQYGQNQNQYGQQAQNYVYGDPAQPQGDYAAYGYQQPYGYGAMAPHGASPEAPYGIDPKTGIPFSDKEKTTAGLLGIFLGGLGIGRFYTGHTTLGVLQLVVSIVTFGAGALWGLIDGILMLTGDPTDAKGRPLR